MPKAFVKGQADQLIKNSRATHFSPTNRGLLRRELDDGM